MCSIMSHDALFSSFFKMSGIPIVIFLCRMPLVLVTDISIYSGLPKSYMLYPVALFLLNGNARSLAYSGRMPFDTFFFSRIVKYHYWCYTHHSSNLLKNFLLCSHLLSIDILKMFSRLLL